MAQPVFPPSFPPRPPSVRTSEPSVRSSEQSVRTPDPSLRTSGGSRERQSLAPNAAADGTPSLEEIVRIAHEAGHSDVHLGVGEVPRYRARGDMQGTQWPVTRADVFQAWLQEILTPQQIDAFGRDKEFDGSHAFPFVRVRINLMDSWRGPAMVLRLIPQTILTMEQLNLPSVLQSLAARPKGLILVTGPTGSGKSTTLAAMIDWINRTVAKHVITIEDPVEFVHISRTCLIRQRQVGHHTKRFHTALRAALREDPDVILIGEIRDRDTLSTALEAAQTGHLVFGTLHTNSAVRSVDRVMGLFDPQSKEQMRRELAESLLAVISQGLIRTRDGTRTAYHDLLVNTEACRDYIQRGDLDEVEQIMARSAFDGMQTINQSLAALVESGTVAPREALSHSLKPNELAQTLRGRIS